MNYDELSLAVEVSFRLNTYSDMNMEENRQLVWELIKTVQNLTRPRTMAEVESEHIQRMVQACNGHRMETAKALGISVRALYSKLKEKT